MLAEFGILQFSTQQFVIDCVYSIHWTDITNENSIDIT
jgi:hypothetical protein